MKTEFAVGALVTALFLAACGQYVDKTVPASTNASKITMRGSAGNEIAMRVSEVCYEGVLYLVNDRGGMTAKLERQPANLPIHPIACKD